MLRLIAVLVMLGTPVGADVIRCDFDTRIDADGTAAERMTLVFEITDSGEAYMLGNVGKVEVMPLRGNEAMSFIEPLWAGAVHSTVIMFDGSAVHSRNTIISGSILYAQHIGRCQ